MTNKLTDPTNLPDPPFAQKLFGSINFAWLWTAVRLYVGWAWFKAGLGKVGNPAWVETGTAVQGFWTRAVTIPEGGSSVISYDWYRALLTSLLEGGHYTWMAKLIAWGELLVGVGLLLGALTGFAAFFGALMNFSFMLAGTASTNPMLFTLSIGIMMAWKIAGWYGVDRFLLPMLGTPWKAGPLVTKLRRPKTVEQS